MQHNRLKPYFDGKRFWNYRGEKFTPLIIPSIKMYLTRWWNLPANIRQELLQWQQQHFADQRAYLTPCEKVAITWIGHATFLIQHPTYTLLTDPVFDSLTLLFPRMLAPGIARSELPTTIHGVFISHNHRDHLEQKTIQFLTRHTNCHFYVPQGDERLLSAWGVPDHRVTPSTWWSSHTLMSSDQLMHQPRATFLPAIHWSGRSLTDKNRSLWGSWMFEIHDQRIYFAGDTAHGMHFQQIADEFPNITAALMPIGPCEPNSFLKKSHLNAEESGQAFLTLGAQTFIPMHWGTYGFGNENPLLPLQRINSWWQSNSQTSHQLHVLRMGETFLTDQHHQISEAISTIPAEHSQASSSQTS